MNGNSHPYWNQVGGSDSKDKDEEKPSNVKLRLPLRGVSIFAALAQW